jgi:VCBS repeat-containing protein
VTEDTPLTVNAASGLLVGDTDAEGDALAVTGFTVAGDATVHAAGSTASIAGVGDVTVNADGSYSFSPAANYSGSVPVITYSVSDGSISDTGSLTLAVSAVNDAPVASAEAVTTAKNTSVNGTIAPLDLDGDTTTTVLDTAPAHGNVTVHPDGTYRYTPVQQFHGSDQFTLAVRDGQGGTAFVTVNVTVTPTNDAPTVVAPQQDLTSNDGASVSVNIAPVFADIDSTALTYRADGLPAGLSLSPEGVITGTVAGDASVGGAAGDGAYTVTVTATDSASATANQSFLWQVNNLAPLAGNDTVAVVPGAATMVSASDGLLANDRDGDHDALTVAAVAGQAGSVGQPVPGSSGGTFTIGADGSYTFEPSTNFDALPPGTSRVTSIDYTTTDAQGGTATATLEVTVQGRNDAPIARDDTATSPQNAPLHLAPLANDTDIDGQALTITSATATHGSVQIHPDGTLTYLPGVTAATFDTVRYVVSDGHGGTSTAEIRIELTPVDAPAPVQTVAQEPAAQPPRVEPASKPIAAEGAVLQAVAGMGGLGSLQSIEATGAIMASVNRMQSLGGSQTRDVQTGSIGAVAHADAPRVSDRAAAILGGQHTAFDSRTTDSLLGASLQLFSGTGNRQTPLTIDTEVQRETVQLSVSSAADRSEHRVTEYQFLTGNGRPLPAGIQVDPRGNVTITRVPGMERVSLTVRALRADGTSTEERLEIDVSTGSVKALDAPVREQQAPAPALLSTNLERLSSAADTERQALGQALGEP